MSREAYTTALTATIVWMWFRVVLTLRAVRVVGLMILPILSSFMDVASFSIVIGLGYLGTLHAYFAVQGEKEFWERSALTVWRAMVFGDHPGTDGLYGSPSSSRTSTISSNQTQTRKPPIIALSNVGNVEGFELNHQTNFFFGVVCFCMSITLLNIFIAVLNLSYNEAYQNSFITQMRTRCSIVSDCLARKGGRLSLDLLWRCLRRNGEAGSKSPTGASAASYGRSYSLKNYEIGSKGYVWFCVPKCTS